MRLWAVVQLDKGPGGDGLKIDPFASRRDGVVIRLDWTPCIAPIKPANQSAWSAPIHAAL